MRPKKQNSYFALMKTERITMMFSYEIRIFLCTILPTATENAAELNQKQATSTRILHIIYCYRLDYLHCGA